MTSSMNDSDAKLCDTYQMNTDVESILGTPDMFIGSIELANTELLILPEGSDKVVAKTTPFIPALLKLFDEGIVNCRDHAIRMNAKIIKAGNSEKIEGSKHLVNYPVKNIDVTISDTGEISMFNDGNGIDVALHPEHQIWIPELMFARFRSSTNYKKNEEKIVGGKNGYGFKLVLAWSTSGSVETIDHVRGLKYTQSFGPNLSVIHPPKITKCKSATPYTKVTFMPDYVRFGLPGGLSPDMVSLFRRRVYDISAVTDKTIKVKYNSQPVPVKTFAQYVDLYLSGDKTEVPRVYESVNERWEYSVAISPTNEHVQVSFVNGIHTSKGGRHVDYLVNQIIQKLIKYIETKKKVKVSASSIRSQLMIFVRCDIVNPSFDSQTKEYMMTVHSKFGSTCEVSDKVIDKLAKMGIMSTSCALSQITQQRALVKTDGSKKKNVHIENLIDANFAGTAKSSQCVFLIVEGLSALAGVLSGLSQSDRNIYGIYPMTGKLLNVRNVLSDRIRANKEIVGIIQALGLSSTKQYTSIDDVSKLLRYGKVVFVTDQDLDGSHIKGLLLNLFDCSWRSLMQVPKFFGFINTPILKAIRGAQIIDFYNTGQYTEWLNSVGDIESNRWTIKYYKGLGTSTAREFKEYFKNLKIVYFDHTDTCEDTLDLAFRTSRAPDRKQWIANYDIDQYCNSSDNTITYTSFVNRELIHFSVYDCKRSIPNIMDGLKPGNRKVLYSAFLRNLSSDLKVAIFSGYVSEHSGYHHGEASLQGTIVGMAQTYVGSNNINLFVPSGQFGTRLEGGKDSASPRYIFTHLSPITRSLFIKSDDAVLHYLTDDGDLIEPEFYTPIIPTILVNGTVGIGTGYSTNVPCFNVSEIIQYLTVKLTDPTALTDTKAWSFIPYYEGFTGTITQLTSETYLTRGKYTRIDEDTIHISELPIGMWTAVFTKYVKSIMNPDESDSKKAKSGKKAIAAKPIIKDISENCSDSSISYTIKFEPGVVSNLVADIDEATGCNALEKKLKLTSTISLTNMHLFDSAHRLKKYETVPEIIDEYFITRMQMYQTRKEHIIEKLGQQIVRLSNKSRFIRELLDDTIVLIKKSKQAVEDILEHRGYQKLTQSSSVNQSEEPSYSYLISMPMSQVFQENADKLFQDCANKEAELLLVQNTTTSEMWLSELDTLRIEYDKYVQQRADEALEDNKDEEAQEKKPKKTKPKKTVKK